jgi:phosphatidylglycerol:prolipoprotein diacylglycerol transferase
LHHVLLKVGGFSVYTYSLLMAAAVVGGFIVALHEGKRVGLRQLDVADAVLWAVIGAILGARLEYVLLNWEYFREQPELPFHMWEGGFAYHGGLLAGILVLVLYARLKRLSFWLLADALALGFALSVTIGWAACLFGGCAYGQMGFGLLHFTWYDVFGVMASRFAVQPLAIALSLILFAVLWLLRARMPFSGSLFLLYLMISGVIHFALGLERGDETLWWWGLRVDQWLALGQVLLAAGVGVYRGWSLARSQGTSSPTG